MRFSKASRRGKRWLLYRELKIAREYDREACQVTVWCIWRLRMSENSSYVRRVLGMALGSYIRANRHFNLAKRPKSAYYALLEAAQCCELALPLLIGKEEIPEVEVGRFYQVGVLCYAAIGHLSDARSLLFKYWCEPWVTPTARKRIQKVLG